MKRLFVFGLVLCILAGLTACGAEVAAPRWDNPPSPEPAEVSETVLPSEEAAEALPLPEPAPDYASWWGGKWYGWAVYTQASGRFLDLQDQAWDVVAQIDVDGSEGSIQIFDVTDQSEAELSAEVRFAKGLTEHGQMICRYGSFIDVAYGSNTWACDPGATAEGRLEHTISFSFTYADVENSSDTVLISYILRPWGMLWDDVREADTTGMLYENMMPVRYEDWYLPQLGS